MAINGANEKILPAHLASGLDGLIRVFEKGMNKHSVAEVTLEARGGNFNIKPTKSGILRRIE
ncbi:hypothetical protein GR157_32150 [Burkholderia sp. 4701]|nr:hypothetical protein [Burkholderia sp. 4701]MXN86572.1 hypothetical protein [Burkholderia sp. 4812]